MKKIGFLVNPRAGIGGKVGLKGSDHDETFARALELGAVPESGHKAMEAIRQLRELGSEAEIITYPGPMGEDICREAGVPCRVVGKLSENGSTGSKPADTDVLPYTTPEDTIAAARAFREQQADLILFAGGDGTARNIMDAVGDQALVLGIPCGCKMHSGVYAINPKYAGLLVRDFCQDRVRDSKEAEVMDIDEDQFRKGQLGARLYGYLRIPAKSDMVQNQKGGRGASEDEEQQAIAEYVADHWEEDTLYVVGTGSTVAAIMKEMELPNTLLGVDLVYNGSVLASDCTEKKILETMDQYESVKVLVTVIGGQGYIFGRGNQQISAEVIRRAGKKNILIAASRGKIAALGGSPLLVDTGDEEVNEMLSGYMPVIVGYGETMMAKVKC